MNLFERIKKVADLRGMSLRDVAKKAGFKSETAIYRYNQGVTPRDTTLTSIADALHTSTDYLKGKTDDYSRENKTTVKDVDLKKDPVVLSYGGKPVSDEDMDIIKAILERHRNDEK